MKKTISILMISAFFMTLIALPVFAAGGKNHGEVGKGEVHQGDCGDAGDPDTNEAPGDNAQGNQAD